MMDIVNFTDFAVVNTGFGKHIYQLGNGDLTMILQCCMVHINMHERLADVYSLDRNLTLCGQSGSDKACDGDILSPPLSIR
jgi:hypothetical protein